MSFECMEMQVSNKYHLCVFLLLLGLNTLAQEMQLTFHHLTEENGLTQAERYSISRDSRGLIWIGSEDGLLRFDGLEIRKYQSLKGAKNALFENRITSQCFEDKKNDLWFTSTGAVNCYRRKTDDFIAFTLPQNIKNYRGFYFDSQEVFWVQIGNGEEGALYFFDTKNGAFEQKGPLRGARCTVVKNKRGAVDQIISTELTDRPGLIWTQLETGEKKEVNFDFTTEGVKRNYLSPTKGILMDDGVIWVGVYNGLGVYRPGGSKGVVEVRRNATIDTDIGWVSDIAKLDDNRLIIAATNGVLIFDKPSGTFIQQLRPNLADPYSLPLKNLNALYLDTTNTLWVSGPQQEIAFASLIKNRFFQQRMTLGTVVTNISEDPWGKIWCSTLDAGTFVFDQNKQLLFQTTELKNPTHPDGHSPLTPLYFFIKNQQHQWWGNLENTYLWWNASTKEFEYKHPDYFLGVGSMASTQVNYNYQLSNGKNLIGKGSEVYELRLSKEKVDTLPWYNLRYLQLQPIQLIFQDQAQQIYIADEDGRLVVLKEQSGQAVKLADLKDLGIIYSLKEDTRRKTIWMAGSKGLGKIDPVSFRFSLMGPQNGIPNEPIYAIAIDKQGRLWIPGNNGLLRYDPDTKAFHRFGAADGLLSPVFSRNACLMASQTGDIWLGGKNGVNVFKPEDIHLLDFKPQVHLSGFLVNDEAYQTAGNLNELKKLRFKYVQNTLSFQFAAQDYSDPASNRFYCQMVGYDDTLVDNGVRNFIRYGNLPAGHYTFKVWATNSDGVKNEEPLQLGIRIVPPYYQTWWFYLLCLLASSGIIYGIFQYRLEQALKVERLRVKISSDLHDDVGGLLSGLAMQTEVLELTASEAVKPKLQRIAEISRSAMSRMRDTVWAIDARKDTLESLIDRMNEHAEETLAPKNIHYDITVAHLDLKTKLPTDIRQSLYLIYKEAITNAAKHSNGDTVEVKLSKTEGHFEMHIHDNGKVEAKQYKTTGLGQSNMKMRAAQIGATLEIDTANGFWIVLRRKGF